MEGVQNSESLLLVQLHEQFMQSAVNQKQIQ